MSETETVTWYETPSIQALTEELVSVVMLPPTDIRSVIEEVIEQGYIIAREVQVRVLVEERKCCRRN